jgi:hypothetical protein
MMTDATGTRTNAIFQFISLYVPVRVVSIYELLLALSLPVQVHVQVDRRWYRASWQFR